LTTEAKRDTHIFSKHYLGYDNPQHIRNWYNVLDNLKDGDKFIHLAPRGHAKTVSHTINFVLRKIAENPNIRISIISNTVTQASAFLFEIKQIIENNTMIQRDLKIIPNLDKWAGDRILIHRSLISKDPTIAVAGVGGAMLSRRADLIIFDDILDEENTASEVQREKVKNWFWSTAMPVLVPNGIVIYVATRWHYADLSGELLNNPQFIHLVDKAIINEETKEVLWEDGYSYEELMARRENSGSIIFNCLTGNAEVLTKDGFTNIKDIKKNDKTLTHKNVWQPIEYLHQEKTKEQIYNLRVYGEPKALEITSNHKLYSFKSRRYKANRLAPHHKGISKFVDNIIDTSLGWSKASELVKGDFILFPIDKYIIKTKYKTKDFWWFVGLFLAEGCINKSNNRIIITLNIKERILIDKVKKVLVRLNIKPSERINGNTLNIDFSNKKLCCFLEKYGHLSHNKELTFEALHLSIKLQKELLQGYIDGDGCYYRKNSISVTSVSLKLLRGFKQILLRQGMVGFIAQTNKGGKRKIDGRTVIEKPCYRILINKKPSRKRTAEIYGDYLYSRILNIKKENKPQVVYNLQVDNDHSYTTPQGIVANCQYQNNPTGMQGFIFKREWFKYYEYVNPNLFDYYIGLDPAISQKETADYSVIMVVARHKETGDIYVIEYVREHLTVDKQIEVLFNKIKEYKPLRINIETVAYQEALKQLADKISKQEKMYAPIYGIRTDKDKVRRANALSPMFESGTIYIKSDMIDLIDELTQFPKGAHDDLFDGLDLAIEGIKKGSGIKPTKIYANFFER